MKKELSFDYDINVDVMEDINENVGEFEAYSAEFYSMKDDKPVKKMVLMNGDKQIFKMNDSKFILEVENDEGVDYFYSEDINDLI